MKKYLAVDFGDKRSGLATGDDLTMQAGPIAVIEATDVADLLKEISKTIADYDVDEIVIGLPINMDGTAGSRAKITAEFADVLAKHTGLPVHQVDERLTSFEASDRLKETNLTRKQKKARKDALAAAAILRQFLESRAT